MAESIVSGVAERLGNLLIQESNLLSGMSDQVELLQTELKLMQSLLKDADARQDESELLRLWVAEVRDLAMPKISSQHMPLELHPERGALASCMKELQCTRLGHRL